MCNCVAVMIKCQFFIRRKIFYFNVQQLIGLDIWRSLGHGTRRYLMNMQDETIPEARKTVKMFYMLDVALKTAGVGIVGYGIYKMLETKNDKKAAVELDCQ